MSRAPPRAEQVVASVAALVHELRQPLFALKARLQLAQGGGGELRGEALREVLEQLVHVEEVLERYAHERVAPEPVVVDLGEEVRRALTMLGAQAAAEGVVLDVRVPAGGARVRCAAVVVRQVVLNLVRNGVDAAGGVDAVAIAEPKAVRIEARVDGGWVVLEVEDSGPGLPPGVEERLFEPFVTTKGEGTGLGLVIVRRLLEEAGGSLVARTSADGVCFVARFPGA